MLCAGSAANPKAVDLRPGQAAGEDEAAARTRRGRDVNRLLMFASGSFEAASSFSVQTFELRMASGYFSSCAHQPKLFRIEGSRRRLCCMPTPSHLSDLIFGSWQAGRRLTVADLPLATLREVSREMQQANQNQWPCSVTVHRGWSAAAASPPVHDTPIRRQMGTVMGTVAQCKGWLNAKDGSMQRMAQCKGKDDKYLSARVTGTQQASVSGQLASMPF